MLFRSYAQPGYEQPGYAQMPVKYDAFISYRHLPLDKAVADSLQKLLEAFKPPSGITYANTNRITRIFRDETELPTSNDLGADIRAALEQSRYLIVLCSPMLKESVMKCQEVKSTCCFPFLWIIGWNSVIMTQKYVVGFKIGHGSP